MERVKLTPELVLRGSRALFEAARRMIETGEPCFPPVPAAIFFTEEAAHVLSFNKLGAPIGEGAVPIIREKAKELGADYVGLAFVASFGPPKTGKAEHPRVEDALVLIVDGPGLAKELFAPLGPDSKVGKVQERDIGPSDSGWFVNISGYSQHKAAEA